MYVIRRCVPMHGEYQYCTEQYMLKQLTVYFKHCLNLGLQFAKCWHIFNNPEKLEYFCKDFYPI